MPRMVAAVLVAAALQALPAAASPSTYAGMYSGKTAQGKTFSFVVNAADRVVSMRIAYSLPACVVTQRLTTSVPISGGSFTLRIAGTESLTVTGRFTSSSAATGTL